MNYKLAKKLKDAGFPQKEHERNVWLSKGVIQVSTHIARPLTVDMVYVPTLSELIDACNGKEKSKMFSLMWVEDGHWSATKFFTHPHCKHHYQTVAGKTMEEAVANLWLKLNEPRN